VFSFIYNGFVADADKE